MPLTPSLISSEFDGTVYTHNTMNRGQGLKLTKTEKSYLRTTKREFGTFTAFYGEKIFYLKENFFKIKLRSNPRFCKNWVGRRGQVNMSFFSLIFCPTETNIGSQV